MDYDDHEYCELCRKHTRDCWCHPAEAFSDPGRVEPEGNLCPGGDGHDGAAA